MLSEDQAVIFKALSDANRVKIVRMLSEGEMCACRLQENMDVSQPTISYHMGMLTRSGLVSARKDGQWMYYSLDKEVIDSLVEGLSQISESVSRHPGPAKDDGCQ